MSVEFIITSLVVVLIPGTAVIYTISTGLFGGMRSTVFAAFGCTTGIIPHIVACILGLTAILHMSAIVFQVIKFIGVIYLLYLAWSMWSTTEPLTLNKQSEKEKLLDVYLKGFLLNILNPKLSLFFLAFLPQFISPESESPLTTILILSGIFMGMTVIVLIMYGFLARGIGNYVVNSTKVAKYAQRSFAVTFATLGAKLAFTEN